MGIHYLPCTAWFSALLRNEQVVLDQHEHFLKQTYRNRCMILSANGPLALVIPVKNRSHVAVCDLLIENDFAWQKRHWEALRSAYNSSPYFEHYAHHFEKFYSQEFTHLATFNLELTRLCLRLMKVEKALVLSDAYIDAKEGDNDLREVIHPKKPGTSTFKPYLQVFAEKFPFVPNLSIADLLFNHGPGAVNFL